MKIIAVIPARYESTRFPAKLMADLGGKTVISRTLEAAVKTDLFDEVIVATDSDIIFTEVINNGGKAIMSVNQHESGSDRIAEAVVNMEVDLVVNIQGDEPFIDKGPLEMLLQEFRNDTNKQIDLGSLMREITDQDDIKNPNNVKVVVDRQNFALYFSRAGIPYRRDESYSGKYFQHIGIYAFRKEALMDFTNLSMGTLEGTEKLEQLRYLENGKRIKMVETQHFSIGIDTPEDLEKARLLL